MLKIQRATPADRDGIIEVLRYWNLNPLFESEEIDYSHYFVARMDASIAGVGGYEVLDNHQGRTRFLAVKPEFLQLGVGKQLQDRRLEAMYKAGVKTVQTHCRFPDTVLWYKKHYGYEETGTLKKPDLSKPGAFIDVTVLGMDLIEYFRTKQSREDTKRRYIDGHDPYPLASYPPLIINVALTGIVPTKSSTPYVPVSSDEIIEEAIKVHDAGASIVHIHARDKTGAHTSDARYFETILTGIRAERPELICCTTTSGRNGQGFEARSEVLHLTGNAKPDMASLTLGSLNFLNGPSVNSFETVQRLAQLMKEKMIKPELEVFDSGMINVAKYLERHGIISGKKYFNILLGNINTAPATINDLAHLYTSLPENSIWATAGLGSFQLPMNMVSIAAGGHVRVGIEDNIYYDSRRTLLASNEMLVKRLAEIAKTLERDIATPAQARNMLELSSNTSQLR
jgi:uncharacterized protein (DUF849 family)/N-acetylglutamate synthase-like GNAT family acetyltransferase